MRYILLFLLFYFLYRIVSRFLESASTTGQKSSEPRQDQAKPRSQLDHIPDAEFKDVTDEEKSNEKS